MVTIASKAHQEPHLQEMLKMMSTLRRQRKEEYRLTHAREMEQGYIMCIKMPFQSHRDLKVKIF